MNKDRTVRTLELLALAGSMISPGEQPKVVTGIKEETAPPGLLTTELVEQAGEFISQRTLTWFGQVLRDSERRGWVIRTGRTAGGWQQGRIQRWDITVEGRHHLLQLQEKRAVKAAKEKAAVAAIRRRQQVLKHARRSFDKTRATREDREQITIRLRDAGVTWRDIAGVTGYTYQTAVNDYRNGKRHWPGAIAPKGRTYPFSPKSPRFGLVTGVLADECGLEQWQTAAVLKVMHALGMKITVPPGFRFKTQAELAELEAAASQEGAEQ